MATEKRYQVFISSTYEDLRDEREKVRNVVLENDCIPVGMELFPAIDEDQFEFIKRIIDDVDYYVVIIGGRYGTLAPDGKSYTEKEYDYAVSKGIKVIALLHGSPGDLPAKKTERKEELQQKLDTFRTKVEKNKLVKYWTEPLELPNMVTLALRTAIRLYPAVGWIRANTVTNPEAFVELNEVRKELEKLRRENEELQRYADPDFETKYPWLNTELILSVFYGATFNKNNGIWSNYQYKEYTAVWHCLLLEILPHCIDPIPEPSLFTIIAHETLKVSGLAQVIGQGEIGIRQSCSKEIKLRLKTTNLLIISAGTAKTSSKWVLTKEGAKLLMHLRAEQAAKAQAGQAAAKDSK